MIYPLIVTVTGVFFLVLAVVLVIDAFVYFPAPAIIVSLLLALCWALHHAKATGARRRAGLEAAAALRDRESRSYLLAEDKDWLLTHERLIQEGKREGRLP